MYKLRFKSARAGIHIPVRETAGPRVEPSRMAGRVVSRGRFYNTCNSFYLSARLDTSGLAALDRTTRRPQTVLEKPVVE